MFMPQKQRYLVKITNHIHYSQICVTYVSHPCAVGFILCNIRDIFQHRWCSIFLLSVVISKNTGMKLFSKNGDAFYSSFLLIIDIVGFIVGVCQVEVWHTQNLLG